ncbi:conserved hypothetical protein [Xenorhabdus bovienii str. puntauvense]|uniref:FAD-binding PCMH-type domain-containing protein n=2 Tax=Xenorhabdus bovienii TaxID=40576 RepID=A0A077NMW4_XENBV|nr:conserved hypothetical protein [Xenorhabdus bovienii str. puntauvense]
MNSSNIMRKENTLASECSHVKPEYNLISFPNGIKWENRHFKNWSGEIEQYNIPCCIPRSVEEILAVVNWAWKENYKLRPVGQSHNWSPLILPQKQRPESRVMLMDLSQYFTQVSIEHRSQFSIVTAQTGILMETLMAEMEKHGLGFTATPAPGDLTLGAVLAINGHGTAIKALNETCLPGHTYGSLSNTILALSAVIWDTESQQYIIKRFERHEPSCASLLTHLGCSMVLEVQLQAGQNQRLRCESFTHIPAAELFSPVQSKNTQRTLSHFLDKSGRAEVILFPFTNKPWLKVWSVAPEKPASSVEVTEPYNYPFSDNISSSLSQLVNEMLSGIPQLTPSIGALQYTLVNTTLPKNGKDIWGWSKNLLLYVKPTTLRVTANGYAVLTRRADIQRVLHEFYSEWQSLMKEFQYKNQYPINGPLEVRVTGLDTPEDVMQEAAVVPSLSAIRPRLDQPHWDVAVWLDVLTFPGTPYAIEFCRKFEQWLFKEFDGSYALARVEWSKGWAYSPNAAWEDNDTLTKTIPASFNDGLPADNHWASSVAALQQYDPHHLFRSPLLEKLISG